ncbi:MAG: hypothetical protein ABS948_08275 [Solibacillus sp.]
MSFIKTDVQGTKASYTLAVAYEQGVVRINNDAVLKQLLDTESQSSMLAAKAIKAMYKSKMDETLDISDTSLAIEILGHVYPDRIGKAIKNIPLPALLKNSIDKVLERTTVIDCGESGKDSNRWVWDALATVNVL